MFHPSKKHVLIGSSLVFLVVIMAAAGTFAEYHDRFEKGHKNSSRWDEYRAESDEENGISRTVANTASGADITFTPVTSVDSGALSELNGEFQVLKGSVMLQNSTFKADAMESSGSLRISLTSSVPDVVKLIQDKGNSGESGIFWVDLLGEMSQSDSNERGWENEYKRKSGNGRDRGEKDEQERSR